MVGIGVERRVGQHQVPADREDLGLRRLPDVPSAFKSPNFFWLLAGLLTFDVLWGGVRALINPATLFRWCLLNFGAAVAMFVVLSLNVFRPGMDVWLLALIAGVRTILDYSTHWRFYFPFGDEQPPSAPVVGVPRRMAATTSLKSRRPRQARPNGCNRANRNSRS